ncbi:MAG: tRNA1(Val) (adenine(37)-N6)-methyltransferase [Eubacterium sp.]|nr:tRNA1(Val) (adenine(37)-N6)-methyltransferase [Eubacterium sp.]
MDAVLLADYVKIRPAERILDLGCGNGILPLLLTARHADARITGLEIQKESVELARRSIAYNHLEDRISVIEGDIREAVSRFGAASFDVLISNPPYMIASHGKLNPNRQVAMARHEVSCTFGDLAHTAAGLLRDHGRLYLVHRPFRLAEILDTLRSYKLEPKRMRLVHPFIGKEANLVLIEAVHGGNARMTVEPPLVVYEEPGVYTEEVRSIYHA